VINTDVGWVLTQVGGLTTFAAACAAVKLVAAVAANPHERVGPLPPVTRRVCA